MIYKVFLNEGAMRAVGAHIEIVADGVEIEASGILSLLRNEAGLQATKAKFNHTAWSYYTVHEEPKPIEVASPAVPFDPGVEIENSKVYPWVGEITITQ